MIDRTHVQVLVFTREPVFQLLILKRTPERSGYWQPVCGGIDGNETPIEAAKREVYEETGIREMGKIIDLKYGFTYQESKNSVLMSMEDVCFAMEVSRPYPIKLSDEHETYEWCNLEEAKKILSWEHNLIALDRLIEEISYQ